MTTVPMRTGCDRCKRRYKVNELDKSDYPFHPHHCNECVKQCEGCGEWFTITNFLPNLNSTAYQDWSNSQASVREGPLGLLTGRDTVIDQCMRCKPFRDPVPEIRVPIASQVDRLDELLEKTRLN